MSTGPRSQTHAALSQSIGQATTADSPSASYPSLSNNNARNDTLPPQPTAVTDSSSVPVSRSIGSYENNTHDPQLVAADSLETLTIKELRDRIKELLDKDARQKFGEMVTKFKKMNSTSSSDRALELAGRLLAIVRTNPQIVPFYSAWVKRTNASRAPRLPALPEFNVVDEEQSTATVRIPTNETTDMNGSGEKDTSNTITGKDGSNHIRESGDIFPFGSRADASIPTAVTNHDTPFEVNEAADENTERQISRHELSDMDLSNEPSDSSILAYEIQTTPSVASSDAQHDPPDVLTGREHSTHPYTVWYERYWTPSRDMAPTYKECKAVANALGKSPGATYNQITKHEGAEVGIVTKIWYQRNKKRILAGQEPKFADHNEREQMWMWWTGLRDADARQVRMAYERKTEVP